jgi:hypothetical protein
LRAIWTTRSLSVGIPSRRRRPSGLGIIRSLTGSGRNSPALSSSRSSLRNRSTPSASTWRRVAASIPAVRDPRLRLTRDHATTSVAGSQTRFHRSRNPRSASFDAHSCSLRWKWSTRSCAASTLGNGAPVFTGDLLPSNHAAYSLDPFALWTAFPSSSVGRYPHDYYESSATPRRQQRTVRLPRTPKGSAGTAGTLPTFTINRSAGSAPSSTPGASPRSTATRRAASPARSASERTRRSRPATRTKHPNSP